MKKRNSFSLTALSSIMTLLLMANRSVRDLNRFLLTEYNWILSDVAKDGKVARDDYGDRDDPGHDEEDENEDAS